MLNKPVGIPSTTERHINGNVVDFVNHPLRVFHIGRLDKDSDGLLLLTNDGGIINEILHKKNGHEKEIAVGWSESTDHEGIHQTDGVRRPDFRYSDETMQSK